MRRESRCLIQTEACAPGDACSACGGPGASLRACSYHASPGACQASVLCISLWMLSVNMLVNHCRAVDGRNCGKVDNCRDVKPHRVAGFRLSTCGARYPQVTCAVCASWHGREFPSRFPSLCAVVCYQAWRLWHAATSNLLSAFSDICGGWVSDGVNSQRERAVAGGCGRGRRGDPGRIRDGRRDGGCRPDAMPWHGASQ